MKLDLTPSENAAIQRQRIIEPTQNQTVSTINVSNQRSTVITNPEMRI